MTASSDRDTFGPPPEAQWRTVHKQLQRGKSLHYIRLHPLVKAHSELSSGLGGHKEPSQRERAACRVSWPRAYGLKGESLESTTSGCYTSKAVEALGTRHGS